MWPDGSRSTGGRPRRRCAGRKPTDARYRIRPAEPGDIGRIAAIERQSFSDPWPERAFRETLTEGDQVFLVAAGSDVGGYVLARRVGEEAEILNLGIAPDQRRQGLGRALVDAALAALGAAGARDVFLEVRESNVAALALYHGCGFQVVGRRAGYYRRPTEDALILRTAITA